MKFRTKPTAPQTVEAFRLPEFVSEINISVALSGTQRYQVSGKGGWYLFLERDTLRCVAADDFEKEFEPISEVQPITPNMTQDQIRNVAGISNSIPVNTDMNRSVIEQGGMQMAGRIQYVPQ